MTIFSFVQVKYSALAEETIFGDGVACLFSVNIQHCSLNEPAADSNQ